jgi:hypothetical protein
MRASRRAASLLIVQHDLGRAAQFVEHGADPLEELRQHALFVVAGRHDGKSRAG